MLTGTLRIRQTPVTLKMANFEGRHTFASIVKILTKNSLFNMVKFALDAWRHGVMDDINSLDKYSLLWYWSFDPFKNWVLKQMWTC